MMRKCGNLANCKKSFECNKGCATLGLAHYTVEIGGCFCPECAQNLDKIEDIYPQDLRQVCSRFWEGKEVVQFT